MNKEDKDIIEKLIVGGFIGAAFGAIITENSKGTVLGAIAGAAILGSYHASEQAKKENVPLVMEEDGNLYEMQPSGEKIFIKKLPPNVKVPRKIILK